MPVEREPWIDEFDKMIDRGTPRVWLIVSLDHARQIANGQLPEFLTHQARNAIKALPPEDVQSSLFKDE